jgi:hypothetical protein
MIGSTLILIECGSQRSNFLHKLTVYLDKRIRYVGVIEFPDAYTVESNEPSWISDHRTVRRNMLQNDSVCTNTGMIADSE